MDDLNRRGMLKLVGFGALAAATLTACGTVDAPPEPAEASQPVEYRLGAGDTVRVIVFGEQQLTGEYRVDGSGSISMPLIGEIPAKGKTTRELEQAIAGKLSQGYIRDARVSAEVTSFRPFFILGEVNAPGQYPYVNSMTAVTAVAMAGGYTYRAQQDYVLITRGNDPEKKLYRAPVTTPIRPDDVIRIPERFF